MTRLFIILAFAVSSMSFSANVSDTTAEANFQPAAATWYCVIVPEWCRRLDRH